MLRIMGILIVAGLADSGASRREILCQMFL